MDKSEIGSAYALKSGVGHYASSSFLISKAASIHTLYFNHTPSHFFRVLC